MALYKWQNIRRRIGNVENPIGAEVGVWRGDLSIRLLDNIPGLTLFMIDLWSPRAYKNKEYESASPEMMDEYENNCYNNLKHVEEITEKYYERAIILKQDSVKAAETFEDRYFDFVFLDADHSYKGVKRDILAWFQKVKIGGWLCGHDYNNFEGVNKAVDELFDAEIEKDSDFTWFKKIT
jgi:hypothetical protein